MGVWFWFLIGATAGVAVSIILLVGVSILADHCPYLPGPFSRKDWER